MEKETRISREFSFILDSSGRCKEIRHYRNEKLVERYVSVFDENNNVIGVRKLSVEAVAPFNLLEKVKKKLFRRAEEPLDYVNWIGVINFIGTINTINKIKTIESVETIDEITNIANIESIDLIDKITEITNIRDLTFTPKSLIMNSDFEQELVGWEADENVTFVTNPAYAKYGSKSALFVSTGTLSQYFPVPIGVDWLSSFYCFVRTVQYLTAIKVTYAYSDGTSSNEILTVSATGVYEKKTLSPTAGKFIENITFSHETGAGWSAGTYLDAITMVI